MTCSGLAASVVGGRRDQPGLHLHPHGRRLAPLTVNFSVGGTATFGNDYTQTGATTFDATTGTVTFAAPPRAPSDARPDGGCDGRAERDGHPDGDRRHGYTAGTPSSATGTITNDDTDVSVAVIPPRSPRTARPTWSTPSPARTHTGTLTVNFTVGGTARPRAPTTRRPARRPSRRHAGTVTFAAGNATATVTVDPTADITVEPDETVILTVTAGTGYGVGAPASAHGHDHQRRHRRQRGGLPDVRRRGRGDAPWSTPSRAAGVTTDALTVNFTVGGTATLSAPAPTTRRAGRPASPRRPAR